MFDDDNYLSEDDDDDGIMQKRPSLQSELTAYLNAPPDQSIRSEDALIWWHQASKRYPNLSRMAMDYLSVPGK